MELPSGQTQNDTELTYPMNQKSRGLFIIINNTKFDQDPNNERTGSDVDAQSLQEIFKKLGFNVQSYKNQTREDMIDIMAKAGKYNHKKADCFGCAILTHGDQGFLFGTDGKVEPETLFEPLKGDKCPSLVGKPKLFFIQACRGVQLDDGVSYDDVDGGILSHGQSANPVLLPIEADCLYAYSTPQGYFAFRNDKKGSWFIHALCRVLKEWGTHREIMAIMTRVNHIVAYEFESRTKQPFLTGKKQVPSVVSQLTKRLYFPVIE